MSESTPDTLKSNLADLAELGARTAATAAKIKAVAAHLRDEIDARLAELRPLVVTDHEAAAEYQTLIHQRGRLDVVLGHADQ